MPAPASINEFLDLVRKSGVLEDKRLDAHLEKLRAANELPAEPAKLAADFIRDGLLTNFQSDQLMQGKWRRFHIGKYKVLERLGSGGMGSVFLCEHKFMRRRVAVKVLPTAKAADPSSRERFYREAKAAAAMDHPNIVRAYDIDQDENLHFIVMEYIEGASLQDIVRRSGPVSIERACHYISQSALALDHANKAGLVHRDIKPGNVLVDRSGVVKVLDMGLARFFNDEEDNFTRKYDENVLGTADYLAPEQADDSHEVDVRADIYSLGGTFYFLLTARTPFGEGSVPQKLMWHRTRQPKPLSAYRNDVPAAVQAVLDKMMAKEPGERFQQPSEVSEALAPWTQTPIPPPEEHEIPKLSAAASGNSTGTSAPMPSLIGQNSSAGRKTWQVTGGLTVKPPSSGSGKKPAPAPPAPPPKMALDLPLAPTIVAKGPKPVKASTASDSHALVKAPPKVDDGSPWTDMAPDTTDPAAKGDTPPQTPSKNKPAKLPATPVKPALNQVVLVASAVAVVLLTLLIAAAAAYLFGFFGRRADSGQTFKVGRGEAGALATVAQALKQAKSGDRILLIDSEHRENLAYNGDLSAIRIEPAEGVAVVWRPSSADPGEALLQLNKARDFRIKGIRFDGEGKTEKLIKLFYHSPGLTLEKCTIEGFTLYGIVLANCTGTSDNPVKLQSVKAPAGGPATPAAVLFDADPTAQPPSNEHILLRHCKFDGVYTRQAIDFKAKQSDTIHVR